MATHHQGHDHDQGCGCGAAGKGDSSVLPQQVVWTRDAAVKAVGGKADMSAPSWNAYGVSINTRTLQKGDIFVALKGDALDGHDYVAAAFEVGAVAAIVSRVPAGMDGDARLVVVADTMKALEALGQAARTRTVAKIVGITGSVGKTGTKEMLKAAYGAVGRSYASGASHNNHWGVPLSLAGMPVDVDTGIFEMGMNHAGEIAALTAQVRPDIAIITTIADVHIEHFDNEEGIARAKAEIFSGMSGGVSEGGIAILPRDNAHFPVLKAQAQAQGLHKILSFGEHENADARLVSCLLASNGTRVQAQVLGQDVAFTLQIAGKHIALNALAVLLSVAVSGGDVAAAAKALQGIEAIKGRGKREMIDSGEAGNPITLIDESYNASPVAMNAAFRVLAMIDPGRGGRRIAILGDMRELGKDGARLHSDLAVPLQAAGIDLVYTCGSLMKNLHDALPESKRGAHKKDSQELATIVPDVLSPGDVVLVKGSNGSKMSVVVEAMRRIPAGGGSTPTGQKTDHNNQDQNGTLHAV